MTMTRHDKMIAAPCERMFRANMDSGKRNLSDIRLVVFHVAENPSALSVARDFSTTTRQASSHIVVGETNCYRCLPNNVIPMAAIGANTSGLHIEQAGFAEWDRQTWLRHMNTLQRAAYHAAHMAHRFQLGTRFVTSADLIRDPNARGITTHHEVNVWQLHLGTPGDHSHSCPGLTWPRDAVLNEVERYHRLLKR